jgi:hypothetical protein
VNLDREQTDMSDISTDAQLLRLAVQQLACAPQAQRRMIQLGHLPRAVANLDRLGADLTPFIAAGILDDEQASLVAALRADLRGRLAADPDFLAQADSAPREFLLSSALETEEWHTLRLGARRAYHAIAGEQSPFIAITAR